MTVADEKLVQFVQLFQYAVKHTQRLSELIEGDHDLNSQSPGLVAIAALMVAAGTMKLTGLDQEGFMAIAVHAYTQTSVELVEKKPDAKPS